MKLVAGLLAAVVLLSACEFSIGGRSLDIPKLEREIKAGIETQTGVALTSVDCPDDVPIEEGHRFTCTATASTGESRRVEVVQEDDDGNVSWELE